ncbi:hypothetical protein ACVB78_17570, partial [Priestia aryabhattai]
MFFFFFLQFKAKADTTLF